MVWDDLFCFFVLSLVLLIFVPLSSSFHDGFLSVNGCHALILTYYSWVKPAPSHDSRRSTRTQRPDVDMCTRWCVCACRHEYIKLCWANCSIYQNLLYPRPATSSPPNISKQSGSLYTTQFQPLVEFPHSCHSFCTLLCPCSPGQLNHLAPCPGTPHSCG